ncbi:MAG: ParA family protein [Sphingobacteriaceae bacterium]|nr:MAG: ParA family protein [Sphingobacteriaceae bacterium]
MKVKKTSLSSMRVLAIVNNKGGVGKTTSAVSIGAALQRQGARVLMVDLDMQANLTNNLGGELELVSHIGDALIGAVPLSDVILTTEAKLDLVPADFRLATYEPIIYKQRDYHTRLAKILATVNDTYDYVVVDCPPSLQTFTYMALAAATAYLIPTEPEKFAFDGLRLVKELADEIERRINPGLQFLGVFFTRYNSKQRNSMHTAVVQAIREEYGEQALLPSIRRDAAVVQSQVYIKTVYDHKPDSNAAADYTILTNAIRSNWA